jgi:hypothetical protein
MTSRGKSTGRRSASKVNLGHPWLPGCTVFSRLHGIGRIRDVEWVTSGNPAGSLLVYTVRFAGRRGLVEMASSMLHLLRPPLWADASWSFEAEQERFSPRTVTSPSRIRQLNDLALQARDGNYGGGRLWQIVVVELLDASIGPSHGQVRFLNKGRTLQMYELRSFGWLPLKEEQQLTVHAEMDSSSGKVLTPGNRGGIIGLTHRLEEPISVHLSVA